MSRLVLGNRHASDSLDNGVTRIALPKGKRATEIEIPDDWTLSQAFTGVTTAGGVWDTHTQVSEEYVDEASGETRTRLVSRDVAPAWVASDDSSLAMLIASHYGGIEIRQLEGN